MPFDIKTMFDFEKRTKCIGKKIKINTHHNMALAQPNYSKDSKRMEY